MNDWLAVARDRRTVLTNGLALAGAMAIPSAVSAAHRLTASSLKPIEPPFTSLPTTVARAAVTSRPITSSKVVRPELLRRALASLQRHGSRIEHRDRIAIADFTAPSSRPRFHFVDLVSGASTSLLVAHGSGSDPSHSGYLSRFSNEPDSNASCEGAFVTDDYYVGKHGRSQRLVGLDRTNNNALARAIVVHAAWYSNPDMLRTHSQLGRSQGCFAVGEQDLAQVFARLGTGRMIFSAKV